MNTHTTARGSHGPGLAASLLARLAIGAALLGGLPGEAPGQANALRGLWVGQVTLNFASEVTVALDKNNVAIAPNPNVATPTADQAHLRLILHVNGAGQVSLLKEAAILHRTNPPPVAGGPVNLVLNTAALNAAGGSLTTDGDVALVSDERLYSQFPVQPAVRIASAVFDFGDSRATDAVDAIVASAAERAGQFVFADSRNLGTSSVRQTVESEARTAAQAAAAPVGQKADVAQAFFRFLTDHFKSAEVDAIAGAGNPASAAAAARSAAVTSRTNSFYLDSRPVQMVDAVVAAVQAARAASGNPTNAAHNVAASFADVADNYHRFIAGKPFGDMIPGAAAAAARAATNAGASSGTIRAAVNSAGAVTNAQAEALRIKVPQYRDARGTAAIDQVLNAIVGSAASSLSNPPPRLLDNIRTAADLAGRNALASTVTRYPVPAQTPTPDYTAFVLSAGFQGSAAAAAQAAASAAVFEKANNALSTQQSIRNAATVAAVSALRDVYSAAARAVRTELPLAGVFGPGNGDVRLTWDIKQTNGAPLGLAGLTGTVVLPANHPTNPFRHRRHPDHTIGFDITRNLRLDFDGRSGDPLPRAGFGVDRVTGIYREEIFGLHKPLGPAKDTGLRVEGKFELNRISLIDTLNAR